ncbi:MAG: energy transducer TonB [Longimicrobiales bacterium]
MEKQTKQTADLSVGAPPPMFGTLLASKPKKAGGGLTSTIASLVLHAVMIVGLIWATAKAASVPPKEDAPTLIQLAPQEAPPPPPPPPPPLDQPPPVNAAEPVAKGFQTLAVPDIVPPDIPPPQVGVTIREEDFAARGVEGGKANGKEGGRVTNDLAAAPVFTPMTVQPKLLNGPEVERQIAKVYPPLLRDAGIGGRTKVWFFIDETGKAVKWQVNTPSGYDALDAAALKVAPILRFTPAQNQDKKVPVWVAIDIVFKVQ